MRYCCRHGVDLIMDVKEKIVWIICITLIVLFLIVFAWYVYATHNPAIAIIRMEMDNNTLEATRLMSL